MSAEKRSRNHEELTWLTPTDVNIWSQALSNLVPIDGMALMLSKPHARTRLRGEEVLGGWWQSLRGRKKGWKVQGGQNLGNLASVLLSARSGAGCLGQWVRPRNHRHLSPNTLFHLLSLTVPTPISTLKQSTDPMEKLLTTPPFFTTTSFVPFCTPHKPVGTSASPENHL